MGTTTTSPRVARSISHYPIFLWRKATRPSVGVNSWKAERQDFVYMDDRWAWLSIAEWAAAYYGRGDRMTLETWSRWGLLAILSVLLVLAFGGVIAVQRRARRLLRD